MPTLQTPQEFLSAVRDQRLVDSARLKRFTTTVREQVALTARRFAERAVAYGLLTRFQADEVLAGRADQLVLADYRLLSRLGEGESGAVYLAEHTRTGDRRAVKVLHDDHADDPAAGSRLSREAAVASGLCHPNVVRVFEYNSGTLTSPPFLAMEYVEGVSLQAAVALGGTFTAEATAECGRQAALALQHAWDCGLVHRDVKPANLLLARDGQVKVLDFGLVRQSGGSGRPTLTGKRVLGTAEYIAPEQAIDGSAVDCRADIYALGGTIYFLLAGHPPFRNADVIDRVRGKRNGNPVPIHHLRPDVPEELSAVVAAMLAFRPDCRPDTPAAAAQLLSRWAESEFAPALFARIDRIEDDTLPEGTPLTPAPIHEVDRPTDRAPSAKGSTDEVTPLRREVVPQETLRVPAPGSEQPPSPVAKPSWFLTGLFAVGLGIVFALVALCLLMQ